MRDLAYTTRLIEKDEDGGTVFEYNPVFRKDGTPVLDKNGQQKVQKSRKAARVVSITIPELPESLGDLQVLADKYGEQNVLGWFVDGFKVARQAVERAIMESEPSISVADLIAKVDSTDFAAEKKRQSDPVAKARKLGLTREQLQALLAEVG